MEIDCTTCPVRGRRCDGCVVTALWQLTGPLEDRPPDHNDAAGGSPDRGMPLDVAEQRAVAVFVAAGLVSGWQADALRAWPRLPRQPGVSGRAVQSA
jgi:hypothetical protein